MARLVLTISYDGTEFAGSQVQPGARTVQAEIERALAVLRIGGAHAIFAGRTDRGVHAAGQVAAIADCRPELPEDVIRRGLNAQLPADLAVTAVERRADAFHPRFDARWREYRYRVWSGEREPLARRLAWHRTGSLDDDLMRIAAAEFVGTRDFATVAGGGVGVPWAEARILPRGTTRTVFACDSRRIDPWWGPAGMGALIEIRVVADGFLPRMVRNMASLIVNAGQGAATAEAIGQLLAEQDRRVSTAAAPAHGLTLWRVSYTDWTVADNRWGGNP